MAYDLRLPFTHISLIKIAEPKRSDIIIFDSVAADKKLVKRVIGIPGDVISITNNIVSISGQVLSYQLVKNETNLFSQKESLLSTINNIKKKGSKLSSFSEITVPKNKFLVLGDNRDNSGDSRVIGLVPREEIIGQAKSVLVSFNRDNYYLSILERFFQSF
jgi:signal peptidase I